MDVPTLDCSRCPFPDIAARGDDACDEECEWNGETHGLGVVLQRIDYVCSKSPWQSPTINEIREIIRGEKGAIERDYNRQDR